MDDIICEEIKKEIRKEFPNLIFKVIFEYDDFGEFVIYLKEYVKFDDLKRISEIIEYILFKNKIIKCGYSIKFYW